MGANENVTNESVAIVVADEDEDEVKGKVGLIEYILHEHSVLSICFAADGWTPNVPCCFCCTTCCCLVIDNAKFTVPMRIYLFIFRFPWHHLDHALCDGGWTLVNLEGLCINSLVDASHLLVEAKHAFNES